MKRYFKKFAPRQPLYGRNGEQIRFLQCDYDWGVRTIDDPKIIAELEAAIAGQRGGITEITEAEYNELIKKKATLEASGRDLSLGRQREEISKQNMASLRKIPPQSLDHAPPVDTVRIPEVAQGDIDALRPRASKAG